MVQNPSWEANWFAASQEIPRISRNPKIHYRTHKLPPPVSFLSQPNPAHIPTSQLLEINPNIIHPSTPRFPQWALSHRFPHQDPIHPPLLIHTRHNKGTNLRIFMLIETPTRMISRPSVIGFLVNKGTHIHQKPNNRWLRNYSGGSFLLTYKFWGFLF